MPIKTINQYIHLAIHLLWLAVCFTNYMLKKRFWKGAATVSLEMLFAMSAFTAGLTLLVFAIRPWVRQYKNVDLKILDDLKDHTSEGMNKFMLAVTFLGKHPFLIPANLLLIAFFLLIPKRRSWFSIRVAAIGLSSLAFTFALKYLFMRKRPEGPLLFEAEGYSFPSGHAVMSVTFYGLLIYIISQTVENKPLRWSINSLLVMLILLIAFSRVYLRVHYASDVIVGLIVGLTWLLISLYVLKRIEEFNKHVPPLHSP